MRLRSVFIAAVAIVASSTVSNASAQEAEIVSTIGDPRSERVAAFLDAYVAGDFAEADELFAPDATFRWADFAEPMTLEGWREAVRMQRRAFEDFAMARRVVVTNVYPQQGPWTYVWTIWQATSKGTGERISIPLHLMYRWDGDRVAAEFAYFDTAKFEAATASSLARLEPSDAPCPWDWVLGVWKVTGGPLPDGIVNWTKLDDKEDFVLGEWVDANGVRSMQIGGWDPSAATIGFDTYGTDGSSMRMDLTEFPSRTSMAGTYRSRTADGVVGDGRIEIERTGDAKMVVRFVDAAGTSMERTFTPAAKDEPMRLGIAPATSANDWRTKAVNEVHANYVSGDVEAMKGPFAADCVHRWGDPRTSVGQQAWLEGLATHHEVFKDIELENLYTTTGRYPDGNVWTTSWFEWNGVDRKTGEPTAFLVHTALRWDGDKIVEEEVFFDVGRFASHVADAMAE